MSFGVPFFVPDEPAPQGAFPRMRNFKIPQIAVFLARCAYPASEKLKVFKQRKISTTHLFGTNLAIISSNLIIIW